MRHKWCVLRKRDRCYAQANIKIGGVWKRVLLHRFILGFPDFQIDHKDNDGLNNVRTNIRQATHAQNLHNHSGYKPGRKTSRFKGVSWSKAAKKWTAQIMANGKYRYLGLFEDEEDAARAYDSAAIERHGEFARLNFQQASTSF